MRHLRQADRTAEQLAPQTGRTAGQLAAQADRTAEQLAPQTGRTAGRFLPAAARAAFGVLFLAAGLLLLSGCNAGTEGRGAAADAGTSVPGITDSSPGSGEPAESGGTDTGRQADSSPEESPAAQAAGTPEEHAAYRTVMQGETEFFLVDITAGAGSLVPESARIDRIPHIFSPYSDYTQFYQFSVLDLDGDGTQEVVLQSIDVAADLGGYLVLHRQEDQENKIYGFLFNWRSFWELKADGSFTYSNPICVEYANPANLEDSDILAVNWAVGTIRFEEAGCGYAPPAITGSGVDEYTYTVNGQPAGEEEYNAAVEAQNAKPDAVWYEFSEEGIRQAFGE